jgi:hypothetical protein
MSVEKMQAWSDRMWFLIQRQADRITISQGCFYLICGILAALWKKRLLLLKVLRPFLKP